MNQTTENPSDWQPQDLLKVTLDFENDRELLTEIRSIATEERRTPEAQILFWLSRYVFPPPLKG